MVFGMMESLPIKSFSLFAFMFIMVMFIAQANKEERKKKAEKRRLFREEQARQRRNEEEVQDHGFKQA